MSELANVEPLASSLPIDERIKEDRGSDGAATEIERSVLVACPDARPPAYQAVIGLDRAGCSIASSPRRITTPTGGWPRLARRLAPGRFARYERLLLRRHDPEIPAGRVTAVPAVDLVLRLEARAAARSQTLKRMLAQARTNGSTGGWPGSWRVAAPGRSSSSATSARG